MAAGAAVLTCPCCSGRMKLLAWSPSRRASLTRFAIPEGGVAARHQRADRRAESDARSSTVRVGLLGYRDCMSAQMGTWAALPGRIVDIASTPDALVLAEDRHDAGQHLRVHVGRWRDGQWAWEPPWSVGPGRGDHDLPEAAALAVVEDANGLHVAVNRVESQGGSYGIALATLALGQWIDHAEFESPTDSDIPFGSPVRRRTNELFTFEATEALWQYVRSGSHWSATSIPLPEGIQYIAAPMALSARGLLVVANEDKSSPVLLVHQRDESGLILQPRVTRLSRKVECVAFGGETLFLGFTWPDARGAAVWGLTLPLPETGELQPPRRFNVPAPDDARHRHVSNLDASADWLLVLQNDAAWVTGLSEPTMPLRELALPTSDGTVRDPTGVIVGARAVVIVGDSFGTFPLDPR